MQTLPGTILETTLSQGAAERLMSPLFAAGGLVLSQVTQVTGLEGHTIQNWVKRRYLPPPVAKKYSRRQFARILLINVLKDCFPLEETARILSYVNNRLDETADDRIADDELYNDFVECLCIKDSFGTPPEILVEKVVGPLMDPDTKRVKKVLGILLYAYYAQSFKRQAVFLQMELEY